MGLPAALDRTEASSFPKTRRAAVSLSLFLEPTWAPMIGQNTHITSLNQAEALDGRTGEFGWSWPELAVEADSAQQPLRDSDWGWASQSMQPLATATACPRRITSHKSPFFNLQPTNLRPPPPLLDDNIINKLGTDKSLAFHGVSQLPFATRTGHIPNPILLTTIFAHHIRRR